MTMMSVSQAKTHFPQLVRDVDVRHEHFVLTRNGKPKAVLLSVDEWEGVLETLEIMSDKRLVKDIRKSLEELHQGKTYSFEEVIGRKLGEK